MKLQRLESLQRERDNRSEECYHIEDIVAGYGRGIRPDYHQNVADFIQSNAEGVHKRCIFVSKGDIQNDVHNHCQAYKLSVNVQQGFRDFRNEKQVLQKEKSNLNGQHQKREFPLEQGLVRELIRAEEQQQREVC